MSNFPVSDFAIFLQGFLLQASLILALGAQNIFVLNSGLRRQHHLFVALVCSICDTILVFIGVLGVATVFVKFPILKLALGVVGVAFLFLYGLKKLKEAGSGEGVSFDSKSGISRKQALLATLGFTLLNPHVYLDAVVLVGGYSSKFDALHDRFYFGTGASVFSTIWFFGLATLSSYGGKFLNNPKSLRKVSLVSGLILIFLAIKLGFDVMHWISA